MTELAKQFSDIESILQVTEHSKLESPMIEPDKRQLEMARKKVIDIADTKWQIKYVFQRMPAGSAEETIALDKLNKFEKPVN